MRISQRLLWLVTLLSSSCGRTGPLSLRPTVGGDADARDSRGELAVADVASERDGSGVDDGGRNCGTITVGPLFWPVVELVVDRSASLEAPAAAQSSWDVTRDALARVIGDLTAASPAVGLTLFPNDGDCTVAPISVPATPISDESKAALLAALAGASPGGARSAAAALAVARADTSTRQFTNGLTLSPFKTLVLLAAGVPDATPACGGDGDAAVALKTEVQSAYTNNATTCVLGLPGAGAARGFLLEVAQLGLGATTVTDAAPPPACFRDCDRGRESGALLEVGLRCILARGAVDGDTCTPPFGDLRAACVLPLPVLTAAVDRNQVTVTMTVGAKHAKVVPRVDCSAPADGWDYSQDATSIIFCGQACTDAAAAWHESVSFGCKDDGA